MAISASLAQPANGDRILHVTATAATNPDRIVLRWRPSTIVYQGMAHHSFLIQRRAHGTLPFTIVASVTNFATREYSDNSVQPGVLYEYLVTQRYIDTRNGTFLFYPPSGYTSSGLSVPLQESMGTTLLLVDETMAEPLKPKIDLLERNLIGAGWKTVRRTAPRDTNLPGAWGTPSTTSDPRPTKQIIADVRASTPDLKSVILLGRITIPFSGNLNPDLHGARAMPADTYYAEFDEEWTDVTAFTTSSLQPQNRVGDLRWDKGVLTTGRDLMLGRLDFSALSFFAESEHQLLDRYIGKNHQHRHGRITTDKKGLISNHTTSGMMDVTYSNHSSYFGYENVDLRTFGSFPEYSASQSYLWASAGAGGGAGSTGGATTADMANNDYRVTFFTAGASYMLETWKDNSLIKGFLAMPTWGIGSIVSHSYMGEVVFPGFSMGRPLGEINTGPINLFPNYHAESGFFHQYQRNIASNLHGDPTVTMFVTQPPSNPRVTSGGVLEWDASPAQNLVGYHIYRSSSWQNSFVRLTQTPILATTFTDSSPRSTDVIYMIRAVNLETRGTGSYYAASQGLFIPLKLNGESNAAPVATNENLTTVEDAELSITLPATDPDQDPLVAIITRHPMHGKLLGTGTSLTYRPNPEFSGTDSFEFIVNDGYVDSAPATINLLTTAVNDSPVIASRALTAINYRGRPTTLRLQGTDIENDPLNYRIVGQAMHGMASITGNLLSYWPEPGYTGPDSLRVVANDGNSDSTDALISITVQNNLDLEGNSLKAWWKFDDAVGTTTAIDSNPSATKFPTLINGAMDPNAGLFQGAFRSSAATHVARVNGAIYGTNEVVYRGGASMWFKPVDPTNDTRYQVVMKMGTSNNVCWNVYVRGGDLYVHFRTGGSSFRYDSVIIEDIPANQWHHVALSYDFSSDNLRYENSIDVYVNGKLSGRLPGQSFTRFRSPHGMGNQAGAAQFHNDFRTLDIDSWFNGWIDEVRHYNTPISAAQAQALYDAGVTPPANQPPVAVGSASLVSPEQPLNTVWMANSSSDADGFVYSYLWTFEDSTTMTGTSVQKTYSSGGVKTAQLTVMDNEGATATTTVQITLENPTSTVTSRGTPTQWLESQFGTSSDYEVVDAMDHDGDGQAAWLEYRAGTNPWNGADSFRILDVTPLEDGSTRVRWNGTSAHGYSAPFRVLSSDTLLDGSWQVRHPSFPRDASGIHTWIDSTPLNNGRRFYRVEAP